MDKKFFSRLVKLRPWHFILMAMGFAILLTAIMSLILKGRLAHDYMITSVVVSFIVAYLMVHFIDFSNKLLLISEKEQMERELSAHRRTEEKLRKLGHKYQMLFEYANDAILLHDLDGNVLDADNRLLELFGQTMSEIRLGGVSGLYAPGAVEASERAIEKILRDGHINLNMDFLKKDGEVFTAEVSSSLVEIEGMEVVLSVIHDITERRRAQEQLQASLRERDELLKEIHHRVKNNMQIISSLLSLQAQKVGEGRYASMLKDSQRRIKSMALVHEQMYRTRDVTSIDFPRYISTLTGYLLRAVLSDQGRVVLKTELEDISLPLYSAIPCGLIINELVTNSLKHAFPGEMKGEVTVYLRRVGEDRIMLGVVDNGIGLPPGVKPGKRDFLGLRLVEMLVDQLNGELRVETAGGTELTISFMG